MSIPTLFTETIETLYDSVSAKHAKTQLWATAGYPMSHRRYITREEPAAWHEIMTGLAEAFRIARASGEANALGYLRDLADMWDKRAYVQAYSQPQRAYEWSAKEVREILAEFVKV